MTTDELATCEYLRLNGSSWEDIGKALGKKSEAARSSYRRAAHKQNLAASSEVTSDYLTIELSKAYGAVSDNHAGSRYSREGELALLYQIFEQEGITTVLHAGNIVDGYIPKINGGDLKTTSIDGQTQYVIDNYPQVQGIRTLYITGDDHEGWWQKGGFNFGKHLELTAREQGREDLVYVGHVEADLRIGSSDSPAIIRVQHPGDGSAYARSYKGQKMVESFEGGEKPAILLQGHYHVANFMRHRNVWVVNLPGLQDQTPFGRKKGLRFEIGGTILRIGQAEDGHIARCSCEFISFFNRGFYKTYLTSDEKLKVQSI